MLPGRQDSSPRRGRTRLGGGHVVESAGARQRAVAGLLAAPRGGAVGGCAGRAARPGRRRPGAAARTGPSDLEGEIVVSLGSGGGVGKPGPTRDRPGGRSAENDVPEQTQDRGG